MLYKDIQENRLQKKINLCFSGKLCIRLQPFIIFALFYNFYKLMHMHILSGLEEFQLTSLHLFLCCAVLSCFSRVQLFVTPTVGSPPGSSVHGILQARILEWAARPSSHSFLLHRNHCLLTSPLSLLHQLPDSLIERVK